MIDRQPDERPQANSLDVFFYGLFMDADILRDLGVTANRPRRASVRDFALVIGERATLVPEAGRRCYGMVYSLSEADADRLYEGDGLAAYRPETLNVAYEDGGTGNVRCYNLPEPPRADTFNRAYAVRLQSALRKLGFSPAYVASIL